tara:strand:+ start:190 stop:471 length:282 start_codon:yes stop_codon:yes gene_type:complete
MTEKDLNKIADIIAEKVINGLTDKQKELDDQMIEEMNILNKDIEYKFVSSTTQHTDQDVLDQLQKDLTEAIEKEDYILANEINEKIYRLKANK